MLCNESPIMTFQGSADVSQVLGGWLSPSCPCRDVGFARRLISGPSKRNDPSSGMMLVSPTSTEIFWVSRNEYDCSCRSPSSSFAAFFFSLSHLLMTKKRSSHMPAYQQYFLNRRDSTIWRFASCKRNGFNKFRVT